MTNLDGQLFKGLVLLDVPERVAGGGRQPGVDVEDGSTELVGVGVETDLPLPGTCAWRTWIVQRTDFLIPYFFTIG